MERPRSLGLVDSLPEVERGRFVVSYAPIFNWWSSSSESSSLIL
jgi:hypothetical protein